MIHFSSKFTKFVAIGAAIILAFSISANMQAANPAYALPHSSKVAYVTDFGSGINDGFLGSSILTDAITGTPIPSGGNYTTASGTVATFTDVPVSTINTNGVAAISGFDTIMLFEVCDIGTTANAPLVTALKSYLNSGMGKVVIFDGDRCAPNEGGSPDYSTFLFPFTSSNPGPQGATGSLSLIENETLPATLTNGIPPGFVSSTDLVGDSNTFTSNAGDWCAAFQGTNTLGTTGIQEGYARTPAGGLAIWNGNDMWATFPDSLHKRIFDNILDQPSNPDGLPCGLPVTGIKLDQSTATSPVGQLHTVIATLTDIKTAKPISGVNVNFTIVSGPNVGEKGTDMSNSTGIATFSYNDKGVPGTDAVAAFFIDSTGQVHGSNKLNNVITPSSPSNSQPTLRINALSSNGTALHKWTTITSADSDSSTGQLLKTGFTPMNFTGDAGKTYSVNVSDFGSYAFDHWSDNGSTARPRLVTLPSGGGNNTTVDLTAIYKVVSKPTGSGPATLNINALSTNSSDHSPLNMYVTIRSDNGTLVKTGYTPFGFTGNAGTQYKVTMANYDGKMFVKWQDDGSTSRSRTIDLSSNMTLTAIYDTGKSLRGFSPLTYAGTDKQPDLTVNALSTADNSTIHAWMIINPVSTNSTAGGTTTYQVYAASGYNDLIFDHWSDNGNTDRVRTLTIGEATTITAYYSKAGGGIPNKVEFLYKDCGLSAAGCGVGTLTNPDGTTTGPDIPYAFGLTVSKPDASPASGSWSAVIPGAAGPSGFFGTLDTLVFDGTSNFTIKGDYHEAVPSGGPSGDVKATFSGQCGGTEIKFEATNGFKGTIEGTIVCTTV